MILTSDITNRLDSLFKMMGNLPTTEENSIQEIFQTWCPRKNKVEGRILQLTEAIPDSRTIKTHLPFPLLPESLLDTTKVNVVIHND